MNGETELQQSTTDPIAARGSPDEVPASQDAVEYNRPPESTISDNYSSLPPSSTPLARGRVRAAARFLRRLFAARYSPEWIILFEAIGHVQTMVNDPGVAKALRTASPVKSPRRLQLYKDRAWPRPDHFRLRAPAGKPSEIFEGLDSFNLSRRPRYVSRVRPEPCTNVIKR